MVHAFVCIFSSGMKTQKSFFERFNGLSQRKYNRKIKISKSWVTEAGFQIDAYMIAFSANQSSNWSASF